MTPNILSFSLRRADWRSNWPRYAAYLVWFGLLPIGLICAIWEGYSNYSGEQYAYDVNADAAVANINSAISDRSARLLAAADMLAVGIGEEGNRFSADKFSKSCNVLLRTHPEVVAIEWREQPTKSPFGNTPDYAVTASEGSLRRGALNIVELRSMAAHESSLSDKAFPTPFYSEAGALTAYFSVIISRSDPQGFAIRNASTRSILVIVVDGAKFLDGPARNTVRPYFQLAADAGGVSLISPITSYRQSVRTWTFTGGLGSPLRLSLEPLTDTPSFWSWSFAGLSGLAIICVVVTSLFALAFLERFHALGLAEEKSRIAIQEIEADHRSKIFMLIRQAEARKVKESSEMVAGILHNVRGAMSGLILSLQDYSAFTVGGPKAALALPKLRVLEEKISVVNNMMSSMASLWQANPKKPLFERVSREAVAETAKEAFNNEIKSTGIWVETFLGTANPAGARADHGLATQAVVVLLRRAISSLNALPQGRNRQIRIVIHDVAGVSNSFTYCLDYSSGDQRGEHWCVIDIEDSGEPIGREALERMFSPVYDPDRPTESNLNLVAQIMEAHKGIIGVSSQPGIGTVFSLFFSVAPASVHARITKVASSDPTPFYHAARGLALQGTALVVDDEARIRVPLRGALEGHGLKVVEATNGAEAIDLVNSEKFKPSVILMDHNLGPGIDGLQVAQRIREIERLKNVPIIHISATIPLDLSETDVDVFLGKPFSHATVAEALARVLKKS